MGVPQLCVIDVDGTLLTSRHQVTAGTRAALAQARAAGVQVMLASSRGPGALLPVLAGAGATAGEVFVASQGALTGRLCGPGDRIEVLRRRPAPLAAALELADSAVAAGLAVGWFTGADWLVSHVDDQVRSETSVVGVQPRVADLSGQGEGPDKMMLICPDVAVLEMLRRALPSGLQAQVSNPTYLEVTAAGVDKASAVAAYCTEAGIPAAAVVAIGDGPNDLGLFAYAGTCVAPANARPEVLERADLVVASNDDDGVAEAIRTLL